MSCKTILPTNIDEIINALDLVGCERLIKTKEQINKIENFNNALKIDEEFLSLMIDEYEAGAFRDFESNLRELVRFAQQNYPKLGTVEAVKKVFEAVGIEANLEEWFSYGGEPYHFKIKADSISDEQTWIKLKNLIAFTKNVRSVLDSIGIDTQINSTIYRATAFKTGQKANIYLKINPEIRDTGINFGLTRRYTLKISIGVNTPELHIANTTKYFGGGVRLANKQIIGVTNG